MSPTAAATPLPPARKYGKPEQIVRRYPAEKTVRDAIWTWGNGVAVPYSGDYAAPRLAADRAARRAAKNADASELAKLPLGSVSLGNTVTPSQQPQGEPCTAQRSQQPAT